MYRLILRSSAAAAATASRQHISQCRPFSCSVWRVSGHNRWSKIKHDKIKEDKLKSKERTYLAQNIIRASKDGGPDPKLNPQLQYAINNAKRSQLSKEVIERSILKGQGKSSTGAELENVLIEAMLPHGVAVMMECLTESKKRVVAFAKSTVQRAGGSISPAAFLFDKKGMTWFQPKAGLELEEVMDEAIEAGAEDVVVERDCLIIETAPEMIASASSRLRETLGIEIERSQILYKPKEELVIKLDAEQVAEVQAIVDQLEEQEDLQDLYLNTTL